MMTPAEKLVANALAEDNYVADSSVDQIEATGIANERNVIRYLKETGKNPTFAYAGSDSAIKIAVQVRLNQYRRASTMEDPRMLDELPGAVDIDQKGLGFEVCDSCVGPDGKPSLIPWDMTDDLMIQGTIARQRRPYVPLGIVKSGNVIQLHVMRTDSDFDHVTAALDFDPLGRTAAMESLGKHKFAPFDIERYTAIPTTCDFCAGFGISPESDRIPMRNSLVAKLFKHRELATLPVSCYGLVVFLRHCHPCMESLLQENRYG